MSNLHFQACLKEGEQSEIELKLLFEEQGYSVIRSNNSDWDLQISKDDFKRTFEVKTDMLVNDTGNVAIEINKTIHGENKDSGLTISKADYYAYKLIRDKYFYLISKIDLEAFISKSSFPTVKGGDRDDYNVVLIPKQDFIDACTEKIERKIMNEFNSKFLKKKQ